MSIRSGWIQLFQNSGCRAAGLCRGMLCAVTVSGGCIAVALRLAVHAIATLQVQAGSCSV